MNMAPPKVSVIVIAPVHDDAAHLPRCLDSIIGQTLKDIEIIVVGAAEASLAAYRNHPNLRFIRGESEGLLQARLSGLRAAGGDYVFYVDSTDWISFNVCEIALYFAERDQADIVKISSLCVDQNGRQAPMKWADPQEGAWHGEEIRQAFFSGILKWTIQGKLIRREPALRAMEVLAEETIAPVSYSEDLAQTFPLYLLAETYIATDLGGAFYYYAESPARNGTNITPRLLTTIYDDQRAVIACCHGLLERLERPQSDRAQLDRLLATTLFRFMWTHALSVGAAHRPAPLLQLLDIFSFAQGTAVAQLPDGDFGQLAAAAGAVHIPPAPVRHIGIVIENMRIGGARRVAAMQIAMFLSQGYRVTLLTDEPAHPDDFDMADCPRFVLPSIRERAARWDMLQSRCRQQEIDLCLLYDGWAYYYDILAARLAGVRAVAYDHNMPLALSYSNNSRLTEFRRHAYPVVDALICLSDIFALWLQSMGVRAYAIPNPLTFNRRSAKRTDGKLKQILFVGRLIRNKGFSEALRVVALVKREEPEAKLVFCGQFEDADSEREFHKQVQELGLAGTIHLAGQTTDVARYYEQASLLILPSQFEGSPMVLVEAKAHGLPCVVFAMRYLADEDEAHGTIMVEKNDVDGMASAVLRLLQDRDYWQSLSDNAADGLERYNQAGIEARWSALFETLGNGTVEELCRNQECGTTPRQLLDIVHEEWACVERKWASIAHNNLNVALALAQERDQLKQKLQLVEQSLAATQQINDVLMKNRPTG